jgi:hypothetical protein
MTAGGTVMSQGSDGAPDNLTTVHVKISCAEAQVLLVPVDLRLPAALAQGLSEAVRTGRAEDYGDDIHPAMAELLDWLEAHREVWEDQIDYGVHCQDGEDLEIRWVELPDPLPD